jgi:NTP pyrophosphatase (non-canonical NTP hydrolase)
VFDHTSAVLMEVLDERVRQDAKWGPSASRPAPGLSVLVEEVGEVAAEMQEDGDAENYRVELVQVAAVAVAMIEAYDRDLAAAGWLHEQA